MKRLIGFLSVSTLAVALAAPLAAQTIRVTASVPFEFMVAGRSMPAGDYVVERAGGTAAIRVSNGNAGVLSLALNSSASPKEQTGQALLIFHRYGDQYFLSRIVDGSQEHRCGTSRFTHREGTLQDRFSREIRNGCGSGAALGYGGGSWLRRPGTGIPGRSAFLGRSSPRIGVATENGKCTIDLLRQYHASQLVRKRHCGQTEQHVGVPAPLGGETIGPANHEHQIACLELRLGDHPGEAT